MEGINWRLKMNKLIIALYLVFSTSIMFTIIAIGNCWDFALIEFFIASSIISISMIILLGLSKIIKWFVE